MVQKVAFLVIFVLLMSGCNFEYSLTGEIQDIGSSLQGEWRSSDGKETVEILSGVNGFRIRHTEGDSTSLFENGVILKTNGLYFLQARYLAFEKSNGTKYHPYKVTSPWLVRAFERKGEKIILRNLGTVRKEKFRTAREFRSAFATAIHRDDFIGASTTYQKVASLETLEGNVANWTLGTHKDAFTDKITYWASVESSSGTDATLQLECDTNQRLEVWFRWPGPLEDLFPPGVLDANGVKIDLRFDSHTPDELAFIPLKNWKDVYSVPPDDVSLWEMGVGMASIMNPSLRKLRFDYAKELPRRIARSKKLLARAYGKYGNNMTAVFDLDGSDRVVRHFKTVCAN